MALTSPKPTIRCGSDYSQYVYGVAASVDILAGALVILAAGFARPGRVGQGADNAAKAADAATYKAVGVAAQTVKGGAANGDVTLEVMAGEFIFENAAGADAVTVAEIGSPVYIVDDETVGKTNPNNTRAKAGICLNLDGAGVIVRIAPGA